MPIMTRGLGEVCKCSVAGWEVGSLDVWVTLSLLAVGQLLELEG